jgi:adenylate cyclase
VASHDGRVVKLIGDEVMFAIEDPAQAAQLALGLIGEVALDPQLPEVRVGLAAGPVVSHHGDYYGDVVNLAARLVKAAEPGTALATEAVAVHTHAEPVELPPLKGYDAPVRAWRLGPG